MTEVVMYRADDGKLFPTERECLYHEKFCRWLSWNDEGGKETNPCNIFYIYFPTDDAYENFAKEWHNDSDFMGLSEEEYDGTGLYQWNECAERFEWIFDPNCADLLINLGTDIKGMRGEETK